MELRPVIQPVKACVTGMSPFSVSAFTFCISRMTHQEEEKTKTAMQKEDSLLHLIPLREGEAPDELPRSIQDYFWILVSFFFVSFLDFFLLG